MTNDHHLTCPDCGDFLKVSVTPTTKCENCGSIVTLLQCGTCEFRSKECFIFNCCSAKRRPLRENVRTNTGNSAGDDFGSCGVKCIIISSISAVLVSLIIFSMYNSSKISDTDNVDISKLKKNYPLQRNETWYHFLSVLENKVPSVKSVIFLHGEDERTSHCLVNELVFLFSSNKIKNFEDITFSNLKYEAKDYGLVLEHYRPIVKKYGVLITDLTKVNGNTARIFHSLCDEISSDIKPSLFIFTLKYDERIEDLKPIERAVNILKKIWHDLPQSEMFPLFSRVIKHVIDVVPEEQVSCQSR